ncbi:MAG: hypothetical protein JRK26_02860 [Deltaproteobacteria bacterium]|nr:hypothetical protein [Deltaproteobacteria bacterium]MBW1993545.1 hypothetical protein [Deltaproteobacteria bacterium]
MIVQATLTVNEAKWIIAKAIAKLPVVQAALSSGKIFLKGGSTVSAVCEELMGVPLRISGRITPSGAKTGRTSNAGFHSALIHNGKVTGIDDDLPETIEALGREDVAIIGANAFDACGNAALMYGASLGGGPGRIISGLMAEVKHVLIPVGWEKFVPGSLPDIISNTSRKSVDRAMGMAVGLSPLIGRIITETDAIKLLGRVQCAIIGMGGIAGAEGATTLTIEGSKQEVEKIFDLILSVKGKDISGCPESLEECDFPNEKCRGHRACIYKGT